MLFRSQAFKVMFSSSNTHQNITRAAILQKSAEVCRDLILQQGGNFVQVGKQSKQTVMLTSAHLRAQNMVIIMEKDDMKNNPVLNIN